MEIEREEVDRCGDEAGVERGMAKRRERVAGYLGAQANSMSEALPAVIRTFAEAAVIHNR